MQFKYYHLDSFTDIPFTGNPAAVCIFTEFPENNIMQKVAAEINLSETAFIVIRDIVKNKMLSDIKWFTPSTEVPLCGHATLATAKVLFDEYPELESIQFNSKSGLLYMEKNKEDYIIMNFPIDDLEEYSFSSEFFKALGIEKSVYSGRSKNLLKGLIEIENIQNLEKITPDYELLLKNISIEELRGLIITSRDYGENDFVSRYFAPWVGINEDPVTGSAHTVLAAYWSEKLGKTEMKCEQLSERKGFMKLKVNNDRVLIYGKVIPIIKGEIQI